MNIRGEIRKLLERVAKLEREAAKSEQPEPKVVKKKVAKKKTA